MGEYIVEADRVKNRFIELVVTSPPEKWKLVKETDDGVKVFSRKSEELKGNMYKTEVILDASPERVFAMVCPVKPYRIQWDDLLETLETARELDSRRFLIYHVTHPAAKGLVSARDSLDVVTVGETENYFFVAAGGIDHPEYPPNPKFVRTFQHPAGYIIEKIPGNPNQCKWTMLFHIDLNMGSLANFIIDKVKPTLMLQKVQALRKGLNTISVEEKHLGIGDLDKDLGDRSQSDLDDTQPGAE